MAYSSHPSGRREMTHGGGHPQPHNGGHAGGSHAAPRYMQKKHHRRRGHSSSPMGRVILINAPFDGGDESEDIHTVTVDKSPDGRLGFSVRGGSEHGLGIFVSKVDDDSSAEQAGLSVGDKLMEVNGISLESITMSSAVKVLTGNNRLKMVIRRVGKVPGIRFSKEKTTWVDLIHRRMVVEENGRTTSDTSSGSALRRIVHLYTTSDDYCLGFNIRGGKEFGLGIYVSKLDPGGLAELHGIKMGDQILAANGVSFDDITHSNAVEVLKSHTHVMLTIREAGRYPAYKEMVAEYSWLNTLGNAGTASSSQGSESFSSASSLSSGTPVSSLSGLSQVLFPPVFGSDMVDVAICTEDCSGRPSSAERIAETAIRTEPRSLSHHDHLSMYSNPPVSPETSRTVGATIILKDTVIRGKGEGPREAGGAKEVGRGRSRTLSSGEQQVAKDSPKTAVLLALSTPRKPIRRSQSHITVKEDKQKKRKHQKGKSEAGSKGTLQRSKTFVNLLFKRDRKEKSRSRSPSLHGDRDKERGRHFQLLSSPRETRAGVRDGSLHPRPETLEQVENIARKLLSPDEVAAVMRHSRRFLSENVIEDLVRPLLAILDRPEKLLLLREIRLLIPVPELARFDSMVMPFELEAYDILKSRSLRSAALRSPSRGTPRRHLITPVPDYRGGFHLKPVQDSERERHLFEDMEMQRVWGLQAGLVPPSRAFTPLLDVPVDAYPPSTMRSHSRSPSPAPSSPAHSYLHAQHGRLVHLSPHRRENDGETSRGGETARTALDSNGGLAAATAAERGRPPVRNGHGGRGTRRDQSPDSVDARRRRLDGYTEVSVHVPTQQRQRQQEKVAVESPQQPPVDKSRPARPEGSQQLNGHSPRNGYRVKRRATQPPGEYEVIAVTISKAKPSLGISISGGMESRVQPMIKIERIFPGGAASTCDVLKAGYELVSVDSESLQGVTHQHAVDVIRRAFSNKAKDPMVFVVKIPKVTPSSPALASLRD